MLSEKYEKIPGFDIKKSEMKDTFDIIIEDKNFSIYFLYKIFLCYTLNEKFSIKSIYLILNRSQKDMFYIYKKIDLDSILTTNYENFKKTISIYIYNDWEYVSSFNLVGFRVFYWNGLLKNINFPVYSWANENNDKIDKDLDEKEVLKKKISILESKLKEYENNDKSNK